MKSVMLHGDRRVEIVEVPDPRPGGEFALVRVLVTPLCTEYKAYRDGGRGESLGHEAAGEVVETGRAGSLRPGDRVVVMPQYPCGRCALCIDGEYIHCRDLVDPLKETGSRSGRATYAQYLLKQDWLLLPVPEDISLEHASMACCGLGPTFGAMQTARVDAFDTILIAGMGPVGLGGVINATSRGARVIAVEGHPYRRQLALDLGASAALDPSEGKALETVLDLTGGLGADVGVDCSGAPEAQRLLLDGVRRKGRIAFVGEAGPLQVKVSQDLIRKGLTLHGQWHWNLRDAPRMMEVIRRTGPKLDRLITHRFPMSRVRDAWELQVTGNCGKVLMDPRA